MKLPELEIGIRIQRKDGTVEEYWEPGHSWTRHAWNLWAAALADMPGCGVTASGMVAGTLASYRTINTSTIDSLTYASQKRGSGVTGNGFSAAAGAASGVCVGSGDAAFDFDRCGTTGKHNTLDAQIAHGTSANQLEYGASEYPELAFVLGNWRAEWTREFTNSSGGDVTIREVGLRGLRQLFSTTNNHRIHARDVLGAAITLANTEAVTFKYRIIMSFASLGGNNWTRNAYNWLFANIADANGDGDIGFGSGYMSARNTAGNIYASNTLFAERQAANLNDSGYSNAYGLVVGSGNMAFSVEDYALATKITTLTTPSIGFSDHGAKNYASKKWTITWSREYTNNTASDITVREIGMEYGARFFDATNRGYLFYRKVLDTPVTIVPAASHTFEIEMTVDFGSVD